MNEGLNNRPYLAPQLKTPRAEPLEAPYFYPGDMSLSYRQHWMAAAAACDGAADAADPVACHAVADTGAGDARRHAAAARAAPAAARHG